MNEQKLNLKFVGEVEKYPQLYNYRLPEYSRKDLLEKAWSAVGKEVNLTVSECKDKWKNLRTVFIRHLKPAPSGSGTKKKTPYYLTEAMQFTLPFVKAVTATSHGNLPYVDREVDDIPENDDTQSESQHQSQNVSHHDQSSQIEEPSQPEQPLQRERVQREQPLPNSLEGRPQSHSTHKRKRSTNEVDNTFMDYFKAKKAAITSTSSGRSEAKKMFLLSLLPELDEMNDQQMKMFKRKVLQVIDDILGTNPPTPTLLSPRSVVFTPLSSPMSPTSSSVSAAAYYERVQQEVIDNPTLRYQISNTGQDLTQVTEDPLLQHSLKNSQGMQQDTQVYPQYPSAHITQL